MQPDHLLPALIRAPRLRLLCVLSSTLNPHSAPLFNLRGLAHRLSPRVALELAIDDANPATTEAVVQLAAELEAPVHLGRGAKAQAPALTANRDLPALLARHRFDAVECVGLQAAVTLEHALDHLQALTLIYTPHYRTHWAASLDPSLVATISQAHHRVLQMSDATLCATRHERAQLQSLTPHRNTCYHLPLGCHFDHFPPGPDKRPPRLLFLGNPEETYKRFDRALETLRLLRSTRPALTLLVLNPAARPLALSLPPDLLHAVEYRRLTTLEELPQALAHSTGLLQLADDAGFSLPVLLALATRTPAFVNEIPACFSAFGVFQGATFCPGGDAETTARLIGRQLDRAPALLAAMRQDEHHLKRTFDPSRLARRKWELLAAAWFRRYRRARTA